MDTSKEEGLPFSYVKGKVRAKIEGLDDEEEEEAIDEEEEDEQSLTPEMPESVFKYALILVVCIGSKRSHTWAWTAFHCYI